jgi:hypothetical protein
MMRNLIDQCLAYFLLSSSLARTDVASAGRSESIRTSRCGKGNDTPGAALTDYTIRLLRLGRGLSVAKIVQQID